MLLPINRLITGLRWMQNFFFLLKMIGKIISLSMAHIMLKHPVEWWHWKFLSRCITHPNIIREVFGSYLDQDFSYLSVSLGLYIPLTESQFSLEIRPRLMPFAYFPISCLLRKLKLTIYKCLLQAGRKLVYAVK